MRKTSLVNRLPRLTMFYAVNLIQCIPGQVYSFTLKSSKYEVLRVSRIHICESREFDLTKSSSQQSRYSPIVEPLSLTNQR